VNWLLAAVMMLAAFFFGSGSHWILLGKLFNISPLPGEDDRPHLTIYDAHYWKDR
jgi:hypothetical protein